MLFFGQALNSNLRWVFFDKILRLCLVISAEILLARYLGPTLFGVLSYALAIYSLLLVISSFGIDNLLVKDLVKLSTDKNTLLTSAIFIKGLGGLFAFCLTLFWINLYAKDLWFPVFLVGLGHLFHWLKVFELFFQSKNQFKYIAISASVISILFFFTKIILINQQYSLIYFCLAYLFESIFIGIIIFTLYMLKNKDFKINFDQNVLKQHAKMGLPFVLSGMAVSIYMKIDQIMLKEMVGNEAVGIYSAAIKLSEGWYFIGGALTGVAAPVIYKYKLENELKYIELLKEIGGYLLLISIFILAFMLVFSEHIVNIIYGEKYQIASEILKVHIWAIFFVYLGCLQGVYWIAEGLQKAFFCQTLFSALLNIGLNIFLIPPYAGLGAAWATLVSYAIPIVLMPYFSRDARSLHEIHIGSIYKLASILGLNKKN